MQSIRETIFKPVNVTMLRKSTVKNQDNRDMGEAIRGSGLGGGRLGPRLRWEGDSTALVFVVPA